MVEKHPLAPFLPSNAKLLMLGSFPPPQARWSMNFYYPNFQNDMWRILGYIFFSDKRYFEADNGARQFDHHRVSEFCNRVGIAISDAAREIIRHGGNASDSLLEVVTPIDLQSLFGQIPYCRALCVTGGKAADTIAAILPELKPILKSKQLQSEFYFMGRTFQFYRMPSSSRAYPKSIEWKAEAYRRMFEDLQML